jgi:hypothetical protein
MKKALVVFISIALLSACSKSTQYTQDLTGTWNIYKLTYYNVEDDSYLLDSLGNYAITFTSNGHYVETYVKYPNLMPDSVTNVGTWQFQNSYGQLLLVDSSSSIRDTFTIFDLTGNSVELLSDGFNRYMRKAQ